MRSIPAGLLFIVAFALFVAGLVLMGYAFHVPGLEGVLFAAGILIVGVGSGIGSFLFLAEQRG